MSLRHVSLFLFLWLVGTGAGAQPSAVQDTAARWVASVHRQEPALVEMMSQEARRHFGRLREHALQSDASALQALPFEQQLQVLFLRHLTVPDALASMSEAELILFARAQGLFGTNLRSSDALREIVVEGDRAHGRLAKFGRPDRLDSGRQYFVREQGEWKVELRGERERAASEFAAFVRRSGLDEAEAAFFLLEMRLMRKVSSRDLDAPGSKRQEPPGIARAGSSFAAPQLRLIAVRQAEGADLPPAATLEDQAESLRYVVEPGDGLPEHPGIRVSQISARSAVLDTPRGALRLELARAGAYLGQRLRLRQTGRSLRDLAAQGDDKDGPMAQWRNVGLRARPLLLQHAWLTPVVADQGGGSKACACATGWPAVSGTRSAWRQGTSSSQPMGAPSIPSTPGRTSFGSRNETRR